MIRVLCCVYYDYKITFYSLKDKDVNFKNKKNNT